MPPAATGDAPRSGPLRGYRIIDFTENMAGPFGTMILADQGADVIKVEPLRGDALRTTGTGSAEMSAYFANLNRAKRSITLDLHTAAGREVADRLVDTADVVVQSFRPAAAARLGIDAATLRADRPRLIHASIVGFGTTGPLAGRGVYDHVIQALAGHAARQAADADSPPRLVRQGIIDKTTGHVLAQSVCAALLDRHGTGDGAELTVVMLDVALSLLWPDGMMDHAALDADVERASAAATYELTPTADGHVALIVLTAAQWDRLAELVADAAGDTATAPHERPRRGDLLRATRAKLATMTTTAAVGALADADIACAPVVDLDQVHLHPQVVANETLSVIDQPGLGPLRRVRPVPAFDGVDPDAIAPAPRLGEHGRDVLAEVGLGPREVDALTDAGVVGPPTSA